MAANPLVSPPPGSLLAQVPVAVRQMLLLVGLAAAGAVGVASVLWLKEPQYTQLYAGLGDRDAAEISTALEAQQVPYRLDPTTGVLMVPADRKHELRMQLASAGLPQGAGFGVEEIPSVGGFGQSPFIENALYVRAVETELGRTIGSLAPVEAARVHLALPPQSAFLRRRGFVTPDDVREVCPDVLRHRIGLTFEAEAENINQDAIIKKILETLVIP